MNSNRINHVIFVEKQSLYTAYHNGHFTAGKIIIINWVKQKVRELQAKKEKGSEVAKGITLAFSCDFLLGLTTLEIISLFNELPSAINRLDLSHQSFIRSLTLKERSSIFQAIPESVTSIDLSENYFGGQGRKDLVVTLKALKPTVTQLSLADNHLYFLSNIMAEVLQALPPNVDTLDLSYNFFGRDNSIANIVSMLQALPSCVTTLILAKNFLLQKNPNEVKQLFSAIPHTVKKLDLSHDYVGESDGVFLTAARVASLVEMLPSSLTYLSMGGIRTTDVRGSYHVLATMFDRLPAPITILDLSDDFIKFNDDTCVQFLSALPLHLQQVIIPKLSPGKSNINERYTCVINICDFLADLLYAKLIALIQTSLNKDLAPNNFQLIVTPIEIDEKRLSQVIALLEKRNTAEAYLLCGLLLEGVIESTASNTASFADYMEKRTHDAIAYYLKAYEKESAVVETFNFMKTKNRYGAWELVKPEKNYVFKPVIDSVLWDLQITTEFASVKQRLMALSLQTPVYFATYHQFRKNHVESTVEMTNDVRRFPQFELAAANYLRFFSRTSGSGLAISSAVVPVYAV